MHVFKLAAGLIAAFLVASCTNHLINFDQLPDGAALPSWGGGGITTSDPSVITTQYASEGVTSIVSTGGGVVLLGGLNPPSAPNAACPYGLGGLLDYGQPTTITLAQTTNDIWVSIPVSFPAVTVTVLDSAGNDMEQQSSNGANIVNQARRVHINNSGIKSVRLEGTNYCFDDFLWKERW